MTFLNISVRSIFKPTKLHFYNHYLSLVKSIQILITLLPLLINEIVLIG